MFRGDRGSRWREQRSIRRARMQHEELGILVASYAGRYRHPTAEDYVLTPTHYAAAPLAECGTFFAGTLVPAAGLARSPRPLGASNSKSVGSGWSGRYQSPRVSGRRRRRQETSAAAPRPPVVSPRRRRTELRMSSDGSTRESRRSSAGTRGRCRLSTPPPSRA